MTARQIWQKLFIWARKLWNLGMRRHCLLYQATLLTNSLISMQFLILVEHIMCFTTNLLLLDGNSSIKKKKKIGVLAEKIDLLMKCSMTL